MNKTEILEKLTQIAYKRSTPFCYNDYIKCPTGRCPKCGSDDLMRITEDDGPEYGTEWIVERIILDELIPVNVEEAFEELHEDVYGAEVQVAWCKFSPLEVVKHLDPISYRIAIEEWLSNWEEDGAYVSFDNGGSYYRVEDVELFLRENSL